MCSWLVSPFFIFKVNSVPSSNIYFSIFASAATPPSETLTLMSPSQKGTGDCTGLKWRTSGIPLNPRPKPTCNTPLCEVTVYRVREFNHRYLSIYNHIFAYSVGLCENWPAADNLHVMVFHTAYRETITSQKPLSSDTFVKLCTPFF